MASSDNPSIIEEYSQTFTSLQAGKKELIHWGAEVVLLNRFIVDAAGETGEPNTDAVVQTIDLDKVTEGDTEAARVAYCDQALKKLVALQEEVSVLQKSAREKGISGGLLTIIGQAANQSPTDNGASVLRQLSELVNDNSSDAPEPVSANNASAEVASDKAAVQPDNESTGNVSPSDPAANDLDAKDSDKVVSAQPGGIKLAAITVRNHWKSLVVDVCVCAVAACISITLIN